MTFLEQQGIQGPKGDPGVAYVEELTDVDLTNLQNGQVLKYNGTTQNWENADESGGGGGGQFHSGFTPIGTVIAVMGTAAPTNYLICDGTAYNIADYPELAVYFTGQFGSVNYFGGDGTTTFAVPDLRGEFLRGSGTNGHLNQGSGSAVGEHQDATLSPRVFVNGSSTGFITDSERTLNGEAYSDTLLIRNSDGTISPAGSVTLSRQNATLTSATTGVASNVYATRPTNTSVLYCIATKNFVMDASQNYTMDEQVVGTWIDGKPLYQKTIEISNITFSDVTSTKYVEVLEASTLNLVNSFGVAQYTVNDRSWTRMLNNAGYNDSRTTLSCATEIIKDTSNNYIRLRIAQAVTASLVMHVCVTLQYTKTTD